MFDNTGVCAGPYRPGNSEGADEIEDAVTIVAEDTNSEEFTEGCTGYGERTICEVIFVAQEIDPV